MDFAAIDAAIDVETANADLSSICQVGVAIFRDGAYADSWSSLVDPGEEFDSINVAIHGIDAHQVRGAPRWPHVAQTLRELIGASVVACHTPFDRAATSLASRKYELADFDWRWIDTSRVVRRAWPDQFATKGYGLANVAKALGIAFRHHDALEDARASGEILCRASLHTGLKLEDWLARVNQPIWNAPGEPIARTGNTEGPLFGNVAVFTGSLSIPRREAADLAARAGCDVASSVTKKTTLLIVGDQDISKLAGKPKSTKHLKVEELITQGFKIRILRESDFQSIVVVQAVPG
jgi:DNA polymerase-3 subunit epsilon